MSDRPTYRDLYITTLDFPRTPITNLPYNVMVTCTRSGGWEVWHKPDDRGEQQLFAGEYDTRKLRLDVAGHVICDSLPQD